MTPVNTAAPLVSVVLPTYNRGHCIERSARSVLAQSYDNLELIIVDDGSTDNTAAVVQSIRDDRLRYIPLKKNAGVSNARNRGVEAARGELIAFQDSDDEWRVMKLAKQVAAIQINEAISLVVCGNLVINDYASSYLGVDSEEDIVPFDQMVLARCPGASCWLLRKAVFLQEKGFDISMNCFEDWELALRMSAHSSVVMVNEPLVMMTRSPGSLFRTEGTYAPNMTKLLNAHAARLQTLPGVWSRYCNLVAQGELQSGNTRAGREWIRKALRARPLGVRSWVNLLMSAAGPVLFRKYIRLSQILRRRFIPRQRPALPG